MSKVSSGEIGCRLKATLHVNRVKGEFHVAFGRQALASSGDSSMERHHIHRFTMAELDTFNCSHIINHLAFGAQPLPSGSALVALRLFAAVVLNSQ